MFNAARALDIFISCVGLIFFAPVLILAAITIWMVDGTPILYIAKRAGCAGKLIKVHKLRTMYKSEEHTNSRITSGHDKRVFRIGRFLRETKIDELPQLWDVLRGRLSIVGPRPEDYSLVQEHYLDNDFYTELLSVNPGLISPGTLYYYSHLETRVPESSAEEYYLKMLLPAKSALDLVYLRKRSLIYDFYLIYRAVIIICAKLFGVKLSSIPPELNQARKILYEEFGFVRGIL